MNKRELFISFWNLMDRLDNLNENELSQYDQDAIGSLIKEGAINFDNIGDYGINRDELKIIDEETFSNGPFI